MESIVIFSVSFVASLIATFFIKKLSIKYNIGSLPDSRKMHTKFIPSLGGIGIFCGAVAGIIVSLLWKDYYWNMFSLKYIGIALSSIIMLITGVYDDVKKLLPIQKFIIQIIAAGIIVIFGCKITVIINPFGEPLQLGIYAVPITILWIIGITNAINLLDGLDGLAGGVGLIVISSFSIIAFNQRDWMTFAMCLAMMGSLFGFLKYNSHPASIFMGDTGSLFLGFLIASLSLEGLQKSAGNVALLIPVVTLAVPLGDSVLAFVRRLSSGKHPFRADKDHLHHRLIDLGLSHKQAVHIIYVASLLFAMAAYLMSTESSFYGLLMFIFIIMIVVFSLNRLGYLEASRQKVYLGDQDIIRVKKHKAPISMNRFWHKMLLIFLDILAINISIMIMYWFRFYSGIYREIGFLPPEFTSIISVSLLFTIFFTGLFTLNGLYKIHWDLSRFDIVRRIGRVIIFGGIFIFLITLDPDRIISPSRLTVVMFTILLILFINGFRLILILFEKHYSILEYVPHKSLLVGTSEKAKKILKDIRRNQHLLYDIIGVVTKQPDGKTISNLKNIGTYEDIPELIMEHGIEDIIIAINERSRDEILNIVAYGENMRVNYKIIPQMYDVISGHKTEEVIGHPLIRLFPDQMLPWQWILKRLIDFIAGIIGLLLLTPVFLVIVVLQFISGIFPIFEIENKVGKQGKIFGQLLLNVDGRKNTVGEFLYKTHIYRLPQVINLLQGSLSLVGPRPENLKLVEELRNRIKFYNRRFMVRPGITGWTQVKYRYSESLKHMKEQFKHDLFYLENMSLMFDLRITLRSLFIFFFRRQ